MARGALKSDASRSVGTLRSDTQDDYDDYANRWKEQQAARLAKWNEVKDKPWPSEKIKALAKAEFMEEDRSEFSGRDAGWIKRNFKGEQIISLDVLVDARLTIKHFDIMAKNHRPGPDGSISDYDMDAGYKREQQEKVDIIEAIKKNMPQAMQVKMDKKEERLVKAWYADQPPHILKQLRAADAAVPKLTSAQKTKAAFGQAYLDNKITGDQYSEGYRKSEKIQRQILAAAKQAAIDKADLAAFRAKYPSPSAKPKGGRAKNNEFRRGDDK